MDVDLDRIQSRDPSCVPQLEVRRDKGEIALVRVGRRQLDDGNSASIWMVPKWTEKEHRLKFLVLWKDGKSSDVTFDSIIWDNDIIGFGKFSSNAAVERWPTKAMRLSEHRKWLLLIWECLTKDKLPDGSSRVQKRKG